MDRFHKLYRGKLFFGDVRNIEVKNVINHIRLYEFKEIRFLLYLN